jgi:hypothetical protein
MNNRERIKLIIKNWFIEKTSIKPTEDRLNNLVDRIVYNEQLFIPRVVSSLTAKDKLYLNTLLVNKLLEKETDGTYKAVNDIGIMDRINDLMEKVNNS